MLYVSNCIESVCSSVLYKNFDRKRFFFFQDEVKIHATTESIFAFLNKNALHENALNTVNISIRVICVVEKERSTD